MERRRYLSYPKRHCALSTHPYPHYDITMRLKTHTKPRRLRRALWTRPFRAGQENVFRLPVRVTCSRLILLVSCASLLFATHATVYVYVPRQTHPSLPSSRAPLSFFSSTLFLLRCFLLMPLSFCLFHYGGFFLFPLPSRSATRRVASESPELISYIFALINSTSQSFFGFPLSLQPAPRPAQAKKYP